jgi:hypothetical protein
MSNVVLSQALSWLIQALIGSANWAQVQEAVASLADSNVDGSVKRTIVIDLVRDTLTGVSARLLNLAIEAAVLKLKGPGK